MRHVGDRHHQAEAVAVGLAIDRVVEILGVLAVDGHQRHVAQVDAAGDLFVIHAVRQGGRLVEHLLRELVGNVVAVDCRLHRQRGGQAVAQHRQDPAQGRAPRLGGAGDLAHHELAVAGLAAVLGRDQDVALDAGIVGFDVAHAVLKHEAADHPAHAALEHFDDRTLAPAAAVDAGDVGQHAVAVHDLAHLERRQEQVVAGALVRAQEAEAVRVGDDAAGDQVDAPRRHQAATAVLVQLAVAQHRPQPRVEGIEALAFLEAKLRGQVGGVHGAIRVGKGLQDQLAARDGVLVARGLAFGVRVGGATGTFCALRATRALRRPRGLRCLRGTGGLLRSATGVVRLREPGGQVGVLALAALALPGLGRGYRRLPGRRPARALLLGGAAVRALVLRGSVHAAMVQGRCQSAVPPAPPRRGRSGAGGC